jgi:hypothetical protein
VSIEWSGWRLVLTFLTTALELAEEYRITKWILALLDNAEINSHDSKKNSSTKHIASPPPFFSLGSGPSLSPPPSVTSSSRRIRSLRSASPSKIASPTKRATATPRKRAGKAASATSAKEANANLQQALNAAVPASEPVVKVDVTQDVETNGDIETQTTKVRVELPADSKEFPLPETTEEMIAKAKEMVEAAQKMEGGSASSKKRKADKITAEDDEAESSAGPVTKRSKTLEETIQRERVKTKALFGLSVTLAFGALVPYFF